MTIPDSLWEGGIRFATVFEYVPPNDDTELHSRDFCKEGIVYKWRDMKRFLIPPSLLMIKLLARTTVKTYESLSLFHIFLQQLRACHSLTDSHELMNYRRSITDGRSDWVRFVEGMCSTDSTHMMFHQDAVCLPPPLLPRRTNMRLQQQLGSENFAKKDCIHPCRSSTVAPIKSSMQFDAEHIKGVMKGAIVFQKVRTIDEIIEERLGFSTSAQNSIFAAPTARITSSEHGCTMFQVACIMRQICRRNQITPDIFKLIPGVSIAENEPLSTSLTVMGISQFTHQNHSTTRDLKALWGTCKVKLMTRSVSDEHNLFRLACMGNDGLISFEAQSCVNFSIEVPAMCHSRREANSVSALKDIVLALSQTARRLFSAPGNIYAVDSIRDFSSLGLVNSRRWYQGPKDIMARCSPLEDPRRFDLISQFERKFQNISLSPSAKHIADASLDYIFVHTGIGRKCVVGNKDYEHLYQSCQVEVRNSHLFEHKCLDVINPQYDPPQRRSSPAIELKIHPRSYSPRRYDLLNTLVPRNGETLKSSTLKIDESSTDEANILNFGVLDTGIERDDLMDIPLELTAADSFCNLQRFENFAQPSKIAESRDDSPHRLQSDKKLKPLVGSTEEDTRNNLTEERTLKIPERLICRPWMLELAQKCIQEDHAAIYLPSPLSCIPSLSIIAHTLLSRIDEDFRVLVLCMGNTNMPFSVKNYFSHIFGDDYLIAVHARTPSGDYEGNPEGQKKREISRILVTDSIDTRPFFPLLFVLLDCSSEVSDDHLDKSIDLLSKSSPWEKSKQMIFIAPYRSLGSCADFHVHAQELMKSMHVGKAIICNSAHEEIRACLILSRPEHLALVPSRTASNALHIIDKTAKQVMNDMAKIDTSRPNFRGCAERNFMKSITLSILEQRIDDSLKSNDLQRQRVWMELHALRQTRSYALYDGISAAVSFLTNVISRFGGEAPHGLQVVLKDLRTEADHEQKSEKHHPVVKAIRKLLTSEERKMREEVRTVSRLRMCHTFSPLVITESEVMMSGIMDGLDNVVEHESAARGETAICLLESLRSDRVYAESQVPFLNRYSHVFYVSMDRTGQDALGRLPSWILGVWYAGGLRLVNILVDETRRAEDAIKAGALWFEGQRHRVVQEIGNHGAMQRFIATELLCPPSEVTDVDAVMTMPSTDKERIEDFSTSPATELKFTESDILLFATDDDLRKEIWENVNNRQSSMFKKKVNLCAQVSCSHGNTAVTRLACAIAMDERLRNIVSVRFVLA